MTPSPYESGTPLAWREYVDALPLAVDLVDVRVAEPSGMFRVFEDRPNGDCVITPCSGWNEALMLGLAVGGRIDRLGP